MNVNLNTAGGKISKIQIRDRMKNRTRDASPLPPHLSEFLPVLRSQTDIGCSRSSRLYQTRLSGGERRRDADYAESPEDASEENDPVDTRRGSITLSANGFN